MVSLRPPSVLLAHPIELSIGAALVINGARAAFGAVSPSLATLPTVPLTLYLIVSTLGGAGVVTGLLLRESKTQRRAIIGVSLERAALFLVGSAYIALAFLLIGVNGSRGVGQGIVIGVVGVGCLLRTAAIRRSARIVTAVLRDVRREVDT